MTFFHFINSVTLAYAPYFIAYKYTGVNEYSSFWRCAQASGGYFLTQLIKLLLLATFFPTTDTERFSFPPVCFGHCLFIYFLFGVTSRNEILASHHQQ
ncbi:hypothetical protein ANCCAN_14967 [Ancylostoma caninum]|uniref:BOS complex subunit TMEM147 n=1 Tax=Ancylostoma caninum TaxID=29170 RepID=A0A368G454_ANCCA|nr:hypothetical protein ANCCAN_14967 [Ancylostoma caninum]